MSNNPDIDDQIKDVFDKDGSKDGDKKAEVETIDLNQTKNNPISPPN
jgi:hypothetical protein